MVLFVTIAVCDHANHTLKFVQWIIVRVFVCSTHKWVVSKVFFVTSFGLESGNISVSLLVLDMLSYLNAIQFLICVLFLLGQDILSTCNNISNGLLLRKVDFSPPPLFLRLSRTQHVSQSATGTWLVQSLYSWMSVIHWFVMGVWICFAQMWPKETTAISVFQKSN